MVVFDTSFLSLLLHPDAKPPLDPSTDKPVERAKERIEHLVESLEKAKEKVVIPTPALSEFLVLAAEAGPDYLAEISTSSVFEVADFDTRAAVELAASIRQAKAQGSKKRGSTASWSKIKFDEQIVAIAKVRGADVLYSDDEDLKKCAQRVGIKAVGVSELPKPTVQQNLSFTETEGQAE